VTREEFLSLERGQVLRDRRGMIWTVLAAPLEQRGHTVVVIRSGDLVRTADERFCDEYRLVGDASDTTS